MKLLEDRHPGESWLLWKLGNWTTVHVEGVKSIGWAFGWQRTPEGIPFTWKPCWTRGEGFDYYANDALFWNAAIFVRLVWPLGFFFQIRWSGSTTKKAYLQAGFGWKLNGRLALLFRIQSDSSAQTGAWSGIPEENFGPRTGMGWELGHK